MCGRFTLATPGAVLAELFGLDEAPELDPRYNVAPTQPIAVVRMTRDGRRELAALSWGLIPRSSPDPDHAARLINARSETAADKGAFRWPMKFRRCLIPADGFYEWKAVGRSKLPFHIRYRDRRPFALAGLWERCAPPGREPVETCTILTTEPNDVVAPLHDRMPVILTPDRFAAWLEPRTTEAEAVLPLLVPADSSEMEAIPVDPKVNRADVDEPGCVEPWGGELRLLE